MIIPPLLISVIHPPVLTAPVEKKAIDASVRSARASY